MALQNPEPEVRYPLWPSGLGDDLAIDDVEALVEMRLISLPVFPLELADICFKLRGNLVLLVLHDSKLVDSRANGGVQGVEEVGCACISTLGIGPG